MNLKIEISWASLWKVLAMIVVAYLAYYLREVFLAVLLSVFISTALSGTVSRFERWFRAPRILATIIVFLLGISVIAFLIYTVIPIAIIELNSLLNNFGGTAVKIFGSETAGRISQFVNPNLDNLANLLLTGDAPLLDIIGIFLGGATYFFTVLFLSFYFTVSHNGVREFIRIIMPDQIEEKVIAMYERTTQKIGKWFYAQILVSCIVGIAVSASLWLLGVKYAITLGVLAAVLELVPIIGPIFSGTVAVIIAAADSWTLGIATFVIFLIIQQVESNILVPLMMRRAIEIHPVVILISLLAGVKLAGFVGMLLAIPTAVVMVEMVNNWTSKKVARREPTPLPS